MFAAWPETMSWRVSDSIATRNAGHEPAATIGSNAGTATAAMPRHARPSDVRCVVAAATRTATSTIAACALINTAAAASAPAAIQAFAPIAMNAAVAGSAASGSR